MKKTILLFVLLLILSLSLSGCSNTAEILQRLDALESQVALINETISEATASADIGQTSEPMSSLTAESSPTPELQTALSYETLTDILGKANVMDGLDDKFLGGGLWISPEEFFIYLTYNCTLTEDVLSIINQNLMQGYDTEYSGDEAGFVGDGDLISFSENEDGTLSIGFELSSMETVSKVYALDKEYFSSYDDFMISQDIMDEYGLPEPTHHFHFDADGSISTSLDWELSIDQAKQMAAYYTDLFSSGDSAAILAEPEFYEFEAEGYTDDGTKLVISVTYSGDDNRTVMIKRMYNEA